MRKLVLAIAAFEMLVLISCTSVNTQMLISSASVNAQKYIDYYKDNPAFGLQSGSVSTLNESNKRELIEKLGMPKTEMDILKRTVIMMANDYKNTSPVDGAKVRNINTIIETKELRHCGEYGVLWLGVLRLYGIPCVYIQTLRAEDVNGTSSWGGHVFIECWIDNQVILIDSTMGVVYKGYNDTEKIIPVKVGNTFATMGMIEMFRCYDPGDIMGSKDFVFTTYVEKARDYYRKNGGEIEEFLVPIKL